MEKQVNKLISGVIIHLTEVDRKINSALQIHPKENLRAIRAQIPKLRRILLSLISQLEGSPHAATILRNVSTEDGSFLSLTIKLLTTTSNTLKSLQVSVKSIKHGTEKKGFLGKQLEPVSDMDLLVYESKLSLLETSLRIVMQLITMHLGTEKAKINIHVERVSLKTVEETTTEVQSISKNLNVLLNGDEVKLEDFPNICTHLFQIVNCEIKRTETEMTKNHSGFEPMSPLVEVVTNNTLIPTMSNVSGLNI